ncbi:hypothetical protein EHS13_07465 [Paenibacillus psychroresistens]|uniref:DNA-binding protein n=1 Tax=Paenibacillus psychroresistens TaxID=1778678 RepID=A0A6B8RE40_9BACL|nr:hypothetical protein [Paenibacillus psychroresistens]QGQ94731.1 hypothetical protein EHS13_07465 [Paenibacillus psychroresistens]
MSKSKVAKVKHGEFDPQKYSLNTNEAFLLLKERGLTKADNEQVVQRWLKQGKIEAVLVKKGVQNERGYQINEASLLEHAETQVKKRGEWKQELDEANQKIAFLEARIQELLEKETKNKEAIKSEPERTEAIAPIKVDPKKRKAPIKKVAPEVVEKT